MSRKTIILIVGLLLIMGMLTYDNYSLRIKNAEILDWDNRVLVWNETAHEEMHEYYINECVRVIIQERNSICDALNRWENGE